MLIFICQSIKLFVEQEIYLLVMHDIVLVEHWPATEAEATINYTLHISSTLMHF